MRTIGLMLTIVLASCVSRFDNAAMSRIYRDECLSYGFPLGSEYFLACVSAKEQLNEARLANSMLMIQRGAILLSTPPNNIYTVMP